MKKLFLTLPVLLLVSGCLSHVLRIEALRSDIQIVADNAVNSHDLPGINISAILQSGQIVEVSSGWSDIEESEVMNQNRVLFSGSIGKTYVAAIIMQLVDEGKVKLGGKYIDYFPETEWLRSIPNIAEITIELLLSHTTGLPRYEMKSAVWDSLHNNPDKTWSYYDRLSVIMNDIPINHPGEGWAYSDTNYILLGMLIEKVTGLSYYEVLTNRILTPYKLRETLPAVGRNINNLSQGYSRLPDSFRMPYKVVEDGKYVFNPQMEWTGGGIVSTTSDLALWTDIFYKKRLFSDSLFKRVVTPVSPGSKISTNFSYGMGSFIYHTRFGDAYGHTGFVPGFNSIIAYYPEYGISIAIQTNCDWAGTKIPLPSLTDSILEVIVK